MLCAEQHWTTAIGLKSKVERLYEKLGALEFDADDEAIYRMERYYTKFPKRKHDIESLVKCMTKIGLQHFLDTINKHLKDCSDSVTSSSDEEKCKAVKQSGEGSKTTEEEESKKSEGVMTKMGDDGSSATIQSRKIKENKEARGKQRKKKNMVARRLDSDGESSESENISRDIRMSSLPTTPFRSYPSPGLKRWFSVLTPSSLPSPSILSTSQRLPLSPSTSSSSSDLIHQKYHPLPRQYIENLFADGLGQTVDFYYGIHYYSHKNSWAMGSSTVAMNNKDLLIDRQRYMGTPGCMSLYS
ncbi:hypothetical protein FQA39_LY17106 [Lamprigera yunnana]|nr:hypothetical protein FQA39_LY17106 [Lamprigera yunnana]